MIEGLLFLVIAGIFALLTIFIPAWGIYEVDSNKFRALVVGQFLLHTSGIIALGDFGFYEWQRIMYIAALFACGVICSVFGLRIWSQQTAHKDVESVNGGSTSCMQKV